MVSGVVPTISDIGGKVNGVVPTTIDVIGTIGEVVPTIGSAAELDGHERNPS
jgi:hypothetical protein